MLADYDVAYSLPLGNVDRDFPYTGDETQCIYHTPLVRLESIYKTRSVQRNKIVFR